MFLHAQITALPLFFICEAFALLQPAQQAAIHGKCWFYCMLGGRVAAQSVVCLGALRRVANRESARRVRLKRQEQHQELEVQIRQLAEHNKRLMAHAAESERGRSVYAAQMQTYKASWSQAAAENLRLQGELASMRRSLEIAVTGNACFITAQWADGLAAQAVSCSNEASAWDPQPLGGTAGSAPAMLGLSSLPLGLAPQSPLSTLSNFNSSASSNDMYPLPAACSEAFSLGQITSGIFTSTWM
jgi:hypothetical protein